jgi:hypothetical protein
MCGGIWITGSKFGVTWKLSQCAVKPPETFEKGKCYIPGLAAAEDSDGEDEAPAPKSVPAPTPSEPAEVNAPPVKEPEPEPEQAPPPKEEPAPAEPVKKVSKKKAAGP